MNPKPRDLFLASNSSVRDGMRVINDGAAQIALIVDISERLIGILTDGDIRRGLLLGHTLDSNVENLMQKNFRYINKDEKKDNILEVMRRESINQIPVLDKNGRVINLILLHDLLENKSQPNSVVIMAGGKGTRLRPHTENCPKPMLLVNGKPMLEIIIEHFIANGFHKFFLSVNYLKEQIFDYFEDGKKMGVEIHYLTEKEPLGTAGSLKLLPKNITEPFFVINGDVLTRLNPKHLLDFHYEHKSEATLCVREYVTTIPFGVVETKGITLIGFKEKPSYRQMVNAGIYVIDPKILSLIKQHEFMDMPTLLEKARKAENNVSVCPVHEYWIDIGRPESLQQAHQEWPLEIQI